MRAGLSGVCLTFYLSIPDKSGETVLHRRPGGGQFGEFYTFHISTLIAATAAAMASCLGGDFLGPPAPNKIASQLSVTIIMAADVG